MWISPLALPENPTPDRSACFRIRRKRSIRRWIQSPPSCCSSTMRLPIWLPILPPAGRSRSSGASSVRQVPAVKLCYRPVRCPCPPGGAAHPLSGIRPPGMDLTSAKELEAGKPVPETGITAAATKLGPMAKRQASAVEPPAMQAPSSSMATWYRPNLLSVHRLPAITPSTSHLSS